MAEKALVKTFLQKLSTTHAVKNNYAENFWKIDESTNMVESSSRRVSSIFFRPSPWYFSCHGHYSLHHFPEYFQTSAHIQWILFVSAYKTYRFLSFFHFFIPSLILALFKSSQPEKNMNNSLQYSDTIILNCMRSTTTCDKLFSVIC